jgi:hypothetical protein
MSKKALVLVCFAANSFVACQASDLANHRQITQKVTAKSVEILRRQIYKLEDSNTASKPELISLIDKLSASYKSLNQPEKARFWELKSNELKGIVEPQDMVSMERIERPAEILGAGFESQVSAQTSKRLRKLIPAGGM